MAKSDLSRPPPGFLTGGNAQEISLGPPRRNQATVAREIGGSSNWPLHADDDTLHRPPPPSDIYTQGIDRLLARFDRLEACLDDTDRRVINLEHPPQPEQDHHLDFNDDADMFDRSRYRTNKGDLPPVFNHACGGAARGRHGVFHGPFRRTIGRDTARPEFPDSRPTRQPPHITSAWERGPYRGGDINEHDF